MPRYIGDWELRNEDYVMMVIAVLATYLYFNPRPELANLPKFVLPALALGAGGLELARLYYNYDQSWLQPPNPNPNPPGPNCQPGDNRIECQSGFF